MLMTLLKEIAHFHHKFNPGFKEERELNLRGPKVRFSVEEKEIKEGREREIICVCERKG